MICKRLQFSRDIRLWKWEVSDLYTYEIGIKKEITMMETKGRTEWKPAEWSIKMIKKWDVHVGDKAKDELTGEK